MLDGCLGAPASKAFCLVAGILTHGWLEHVGALGDALDEVLGGALGEVLGAALDEALDEKGLSKTKTQSKCLRRS